MSSKFRDEWLEANKNISTYDRSIKPKSVWPKPHGRWLKRPWVFFGCEGLAYFVNGALVGTVSGYMNMWQANACGWSSGYMSKRGAKLLVQKTCKVRAPKVKP